jgi:hypothetical protein
MSRMPKMTLGEALLMNNGAPAPGSTQGERYVVRVHASSALDEICRAIPGRRLRLEPLEWDRLCELGVQDLEDIHLLLPRRDDASVGWVASAPPEHALMAVTIAVMRAQEDLEEEELLLRLLAGEAGPSARTAVPQCFSRAQFLPTVLLTLPDEALLRLTAPHAGGYSCYVDRILANSGLWRARVDKELLAALTQVSSAQAAEADMWPPLARRGGLTEKILQLCRRLPPSQTMVEIVERYAKPGASREICAAHMEHLLRRSSADDQDHPPALPVGLI